MLEDMIETMVDKKGCPSILLIHCGGNDIVGTDTGDLIFQMRNTIHNLMSIMPYTMIIYSYILPRLVWCKYNKHATIDKTRRRINRAVRSYVVKIGKKAIRHLDIDDHHPALFSDMVHPSFIGLDTFLNALQSGIELFIDYPHRTLFPEELIKVITKLPNSEQSYKGKVKTHKYINRQNQSTTENLSVGKLLWI